MRSSAPPGARGARLAIGGLFAGEQRRIQRHLAAAKLTPGKTLDSFDFPAVPTVSQARVRALAEGDSWLQAGHNLLAFGPPGRERAISQQASDTNLCSADTAS